MVLTGNWGRASIRFCVREDRIINIVWGWIEMRVGTSNGVSTRISRDE